MSKKILGALSESNSTTYSRKAWTIMVMPLRADNPGIAGDHPPTFLLYMWAPLWQLVGSRDDQ
jgi:hypothetical protein